MDRFGSSRLRIVWTSICLLLAGLVLGGIQGINGDGQLMVFGSGIPLGFIDDPKAWAADILGRFLFAVVPAVILLGGIFPLGEWLASGSRAERFKGLTLGAPLAFAHGLVLSQIAILPILAASFRLLGNPLAPRILLADTNAVLLGLELLLWSAALGCLLKSNRGLAVILAFGLQEVGRVMAWGGEFLGDLEVPKAAVRTMAFLGRALPSSQLPSDPFAWKALPLTLGLPILLATLLLLLPGKAPKRSKA
ncbi:hypothetical protein [Mesoterricola silvestris]|uniref:Uncharacterized protein n=1 Tax=Mesoterricola silvestris TaxID=2927979 RepID=A0AA48K6N3_9BACT|nr:hypothetical protein [Mesoterricola silvestris]BDU70999.1 hypothetical protein METEAL_01730 [Mesoterricola silvestris]